MSVLICAEELLPWNAIGKVGTAVGKGARLRVKNGVLQSIGKTSASSVVVKGFNLYERKSQLKPDKMR